MSSGLIALLDDVAVIARAAAASLDDVATMTVKAGVKSAGVVIDDAAVTPRYVIGVSPARELPIVWRIARGSLRNKLLILLPIALALSLLAPWAITPLLMFGGLFLCFEGAEKIHEALFPHKAHGHTEKGKGIKAEGDPKVFEDKTVAGAIKTDFILSAEIMAITLSSIPEADFWMQAVVLAIVGAGITVVVYGAVALIVKADDVGLALAAREPRTPLGPVIQVLGRGLVNGMPTFLKVLSIVGTVAMVWVGGGILSHGLEELGYGGLQHAIHDLAHTVALALPAIGGLAAWLTSALGSAIVGLVIGAVLVPIVTLGIQPVWRRIRAGRS
ncbi:MAG: DUF808 domain-containing protein [Pseudomonadota bacterium]